MSEIKNITVDEFIKKYNQFSSDELKAKYLEGIKKTDYVSYQNKVDLCSSVVKASYYVKGVDKTARLHINSPACYMLYVLMLVEAYTFIKVDYKNVVSEFDKLNKNRDFIRIVSIIPEMEVKEMEMVLDMVKEDTITNEYEIHGYVSNLVDRFSKVSGITFDSISKKIKEFIPAK